MAFFLGPCLSLGSLLFWHIVAGIVRLFHGLAPIGGLATFYGSKRVIGTNRILERETLPDLRELRSRLAGKIARLVGEVRLVRG